jgi:glycosyltransferase involved in cell wall biosynthesis
VLFIGKLLWSKGVRELLDAFASVLEAEPYRDLTLDIVGDGEESAPIKEYAAKRLPRGQVRFWGWIDTPTDLQDRWSEATMLVVPSTSSEGVPRVIDESFVHGVPVIASRIGGIADEFPNGEVCLVEPASVAALSVAIRSLLADEAKRKQLRQNATARLERFSALRSAGHQHAALFQRFCAASRRPERR